MTSKQVQSTARTGPQFQPVILGISGMSCAGCVRSVEKALQQVAGVTRVNVNFADESARVTGGASTQDLLVAVSAAGYQGRVLCDDEPLITREVIIGNLKVAIGKSLAALFLAMVLMADMLFHYLPALDSSLIWITIGLLVGAVMAVTGGRFYRGAWDAARNRMTTMDTLVALGTGSAWCYSMLVILWPDIVPVDSRHQYFEAALFIIGFVNLGKALENYAKSDVSLAIQTLMDLTPKVATLITLDGDQQVPLSDVIAGQHLRIKPGERIGVDGRVLDGRSEVNESMLTGEAFGIAKSAGDGVHAGTQNETGTLVILTEKVGAETALSEIIRLVRQAQGSKPPITQLVDQIASYFVPLVLLASLLTGLGWWFFGPEPRVSFALVTAISVLVVACPCALGLAIPMSIMVGIGKGAAMGLLIKNSDVLQTTTKITHILFDKTGTLTIGKPIVSRSFGLDTDDLAALYALELASEHSLASAVITYCEASNIPKCKVDSFQSTPGGGVAGRVEGRSVAAGNIRFLKNLGMSLPADFEETQTEALSSLIFFAVEGQIIGGLEIVDQIRSEAQAVVEHIQNLGIRVLMVSGDRSVTAQQVAELLGIKDVHADMLPAQKLALIQELQGHGSVVAMIGDGVNDATALKVSDVGFAMGGGTDVALESADIALLSNDLQNVVRAIELSRQVVLNIRQNLIAAFGYNLLLIPIAAGLLYPTFGILINPAFAGLAMAISSVTVVLNAGRLRFLEF